MNHQWIFKHQAWVKSAVFHGILTLFLVVLIWERAIDLNSSVTVELFPAERLAQSVKKSPSIVRPKAALLPSSKSTPDESKASETVTAQPVSGSETSEASESVVAEYQVNEMPLLLNEVKVPYPADARAQGIQGAVVVEMTVSSDGTVKNIQVVESPSPSLTQAAVNAIRGFRFKPARMGERPVAIRIRYSYRFVLQ